MRSSGGRNLTHRYGYRRVPERGRPKEGHIRNVNSQVDNHEACFDCSINDVIREEDFPSKTGLKQHVNEVTDELLADGIVTQNEFTEIRRAANKAKPS